ncbi:Laminin subunit alpha-2 [Linum perenne]
MPLFAFSSNNHFVASSDVTVLHNYELTKSSIHLSSIQKADWKTLATIDTNIKDEDISSKVSNVMSYNRLMFFDGHGRIKGRKALTMLAQHLKELHLLVSPEGYCFQDVSEFGVYSDFGIHYVRLNDFFSCPRHKVELVSISVWSRLELKYNLSKHKNTPKPNVDGGLSKEKYVKLEKTVKAKDEELEKLKEKMDDVIQKLKKANEEQQKQAQKKDKELLNLKKNKYKEEVAKTQKIEELEKINEDLEEANRVKDEELQKLKKKKANEEEVKAQRIQELEKLNEDLEETNKVKDEELQKKTNEDMEMKNKVKDEELEKLQNLLKKKSQELEVLEKKDRDKNDEAAKTRKVEGELKEAREKLSSSVTQMKKELEEYQKKLWAIIPGYTKFIPDKLDAKDKYLAMRQSVPPETFACYFEISFPYVSNSHKLVDNLRVDGNYDVTLVEEEISSAEWPPLPTMRVHIGKGGEDFDKNNWWYLKTSHPEGGFTMLVFYDGYRSQISRYGSYPPIPLPFSKDAEFFSYFSMFSLFNVHPFGTKLCFTYR